MVIGLLGFSFEDRNKGCEALTYSFINILRELISTEKLVIVNLTGTGLGEVSNYYRDISFISVGFQKKNISLNSIKWLLKSDVVFDCTYGDNFSDIYSLQFVKKTTQYKEIMLLLHKHFVLAPQTIGPFTNDEIRKRAAKVLNESDLVFTRDELSSECVRKISKANPVTVTDLAFMLPYDEPKEKDSRSIGINISGLLWNGGFEGTNQFNLSVDYREYIITLIGKLKSDYDVYIIPHVFSKDPTEIDDDYKVSRYISEKYGIQCAPKFSNPIEAKSYISKMNIFIGARMHSTIAAFSSGVVTIPTSYSRKFQGLYNSLNYPYIIDCCKLSTIEAVNNTLNYISIKEELSNCQMQALRLAKGLQKTFNNELSAYIKKIS